MSDTESSSGLPRVSVVSVFHNRADCVDISVRSLLDQDYPNLEIILVDDGSTDATRMELEKFAEHGCRIISHENKGFVSALKGAIDAASGTLIAIHGSGDVSYPTRISKQVEFLRTNASVVAVSCGARYLNTVTGNEVIKCPDEVDVYPSIESLRGHTPFVHGQTMFRRDDYDAVGGYRTFFICAQDHDLWLRLVQRGALAVLPHVLYDSYSRSDGVSQSPYRWAFQKVYGQLAVLCGEQRLQGRTDDVDLYSYGAALVRPRSKRLARLFAVRGMRSLAIGRTEEAHQLCEFAIREAQIVPTTLLLRSLLFLNRIQPNSGAFLAARILRLGRQFSEPGTHW